MRIGAVTAAVSAAMLFVAGAGARIDAQEGTATTSVVVDISATRQVVHGFGSSNRVWSDAHLAKSPTVSVPLQAQAQILTSLYGRLGLTRVRDVLDNGIQAGPGAPINFQGKRADDHVAFVKQAKRYGLTTFFPGPVYLEDWMAVDNPAGYVDWAMAMLRRWRARGLEPPLYAPLNEPQVARDYPPEWMHDVVVLLGSRLRAAGFKTKLVIPDDENPRDAYRRAIAVLQDPKARQYVGALAYHIYRWNLDQTDEVARMRQLAVRYRLPLWMTEYSNPDYVNWRAAFEWAEKMHVLLTDGGVNAIDYLWSYFGDWVRTDTMVSIDFEDGVYRGHSFTPIYWLTGQYSRFVRPGFVRVAATPSSGPVLTSAYRGPAQAIVVATNPTEAAQVIRVTIRGTVKRVVRPVRSSATEQWRNLTPITLRNNSFTATLPSRSVTTFVAAR
jgi:glucuronoarabinoxylan endo-1,4-beta-xylanase